jgi:hypothetical protein
VWNLPARGGQILRAAGCIPFKKAASRFFDSIRPPAQPGA